MSGFVKTVKIIALVLVLGAAWAGQPAQAAKRTPPSRAGIAADRMEVAVGAGGMVRLPRPAASVFVADPAIADIQVPSSSSVFVLGKKAGTTTLYAVDGSDNEVIRLTLVVRHNTDEVQELLRQRFPEYRFSLASAPGSLMVSGTVDSSATLKAVTDTITPYLAKEEKLVNQVTVQSPTQVYLRVRVAEVSRQITQTFGVNWQSLMSPGNLRTGIMNGRDFFDSTTSAFVLPTSGWALRAGWTVGAYSFDSMIDALDQEGLASVMAEPNLTAVSGQTASFLAGGEFPYPSVQTSSGTSYVTVEFKPFGVALDFTPTVLSADRISLMVRPEVSELSTTSSVTINNTTVPSLVVRRMETTVELASGQSVVIGGLLQDNMHDAASRLPGLGNIPVLGKLFSSQDYRNNKSELVVIVTAYTVKPTKDANLRTPLQSLRPASDVEYIAQKRTGHDLLATETPRLMGQAGFIY